MSAKILIVDDSNIAAQTLKKVLDKENYSTHIVHSGKNVLKVIKDINIDVVLLDIVMPEVSGFDVLESMRNAEGSKFTPVIVITELTDALTVEQAMNLGAIDFIRKTAEPVEIIARVRTAVRLKKQYDQLLWNSIRDQMTGLYNKQFFNITLEKLLEEIDSHPDGMAILIMDFDHFKRVNDNYGHTFGDVVLIDVAGKISESIKKNDYACRWGGEEFCVILTGVSASQSFAIAERIRKTIGETAFKYEDEDVYITVSIGISHIKPETKKHSLQLVNEADSSLYFAKANGRNRTVLFGLES